MSNRCDFCLSLSRSRTCPIFPTQMAHVIRLSVIPPRTSRLFALTTRKIIPPELYPEPYLSLIDTTITWKGLGNNRINLRVREVLLLALLKKEKFFSMSGNSLGVVFLSFIRILKTYSI